MKALILISLLTLISFSAKANCQRQMNASELKLYEIKGQEQMSQYAYFEQKQISEEELEAMEMMCFDIDVKGDFADDDSSVTFKLFSESNNIENCHVGFTNYIQGLDISTTYLTNIRGCEFDAKTNTTYGVFTINLEHYKFDRPTLIGKNSCLFITLDGKDQPEYLCGKGISQEGLSTLQNKPYSVIEGFTELPGTQQVQFYTGGSQGRVIEMATDRALMEADKLKSVTQDSFASISATHGYGCYIGVLYEGSEIQRFCFK